jgi:hypothetical protein
MPIRVWRPEGWKQRRAPGVPLWALLLIVVGKAISIPFRPLGWLLSRASLRRFTGQARHEFELCFPEAEIEVVAAQNLPGGWPSATLDIEGLRVSVWTHMGEYGGSIDAASSEEGPLAEEAIHRKSFGSLAEVADAVVRAVRHGRADHEVNNNSAQAGNLE